MYAARANTNCAYNGIVRILACEYKNGNKGKYILFSVSIPFTCGVSNLWPYVRTADMSPNRVYFLSTV